MNCRNLTFTFLLACAALTGCGTRPPLSEVRLNQIQVIGTHNSYHLRMPEAIRTLLAAKDPLTAAGLDYTHVGLSEQFSRLGIRQIELDCFADPEGGLFAHPKGIEWAAQAGFGSIPDPDPDGKLKKPGIKVLHVPDIDYVSTVPTLVEGLTQVVEWSRQHPAHVPIFVLIELKEDADAPELTRPIPFGQKELAELEAEIRLVIPREKLLIPDDIRRGERSLPEALQKYGWPRLNAVRGKIMLGMDNEGPVRDLYLMGHPALEGRSLFVGVPTNHPAAAWMKINDPVEGFDQIQQLVRAGYMIRTRADADTRQARANDPNQRNKAMASGAQFISTDYREPNPAFSAYNVQFDNQMVARINPVNGIRSLAGVDLEPPSK